MSQNSEAPLYLSAFDPFPEEFGEHFLPEALPLFAAPLFKSDTLVICLHGYTGTPYEVTPAVEALAKAGIAAAAPLLPGHGYRDRPNQEKHFAGMTMDGLLNAVRQEIARARTHYRQVGMFGLSMGGAIALTMAAEQRVDVCAVAAPALRLPLQAEILIPLLSWARFSLEAPIRESFHLPGYEFFHSRSLRTLWKMSRHARSNLNKIRCPVLAMHTQQDVSVPPVVLKMMQNQIPHPIQTAWFNQSGHSMLLDVCGPDVTATLVAFIQQHRHLSSPSL